MTPNARKYQALAKERTRAALRDQPLALVLERIRKAERRLRAFDPLYDRRRVKWAVNDATSYAARGRGMG